MYIPLYSTAKLIQLSKSSVEAAKLSVAESTSFLDTHDKIISSSKAAAIEIERAANAEREKMLENWITKYSQRAAEKKSLDFGLTEELKGHKFDTAAKVQSMDRIKEYLESLGQEADGYRAIQAAVWAR